MAQVLKRIEDDLFVVEQTKFGWEIQHKDSNKGIGINYNAIPYDKPDDYVLGYAKAIAYQEHWIRL